MTIWVTVIDSLTLRRIRTQVFGRRQSSLADEAARYSLVDYEVTLTDIRRAIREQLLSLPERAFAPGPAAGQLVARLCATSRQLYLRPARAIVGLPAVGQWLDRPGGYPRLTRDEALDALDGIDRELLEVLGTAREDDLQAVYDDAALGRVRLRDLLLQMAIHEDDHLGKLAALCGGATVEPDYDAA